MLKVKVPAIGFSRGSGLFSRLIMFFTNSYWSHSFVVGSYVSDWPTLLEADILVQHVTYEKEYVTDADSLDHSLYQLIDEDLTKERLEEAWNAIFYDFAGVEYGKLQLVWFVWRWFNKKFLRKDIRHSKNWFTDGVICSELVYWYLWHLGDKYRILLSPFNPDTIQAQDIFEIAEANPSLFRKIK